MCYYGGKEMGKITSGRQQSQYAKQKESINHVPHPNYLPPAHLRICVDLNRSGSIWVDLGPRGATNRKRFHRESICEVMNCETSMCMLDLFIVCQAQGFLRNNIGTSLASSFSLRKRITIQTTLTIWAKGLLNHTQAAFQRCIFRVSGEMPRLR